MNDQHLTDRDLRAALAARAAGTPTPDLAARISAEAAQTRQSRPLIALPSFFTGAAGQLAWAAALGAVTIAVIGALALGGGSPTPGPVDPSQTPTPSEAPSPTPPDQPSPTPSADPSVEPSPSVDPSADPSGSPFIPADLGPDRIGHVIATDGLRVRSLPTIGDESEAFEPLLDAGTKFYVVAGPVFADGYAWYQIDPYGGDPGLTPFGWVAAGSRDGEPWIENLFDGCDTIGVSIELLADDEPQESLYCYGVVMPGDIELEGNLACDFGDIEGISSGPSWVEFDRFCELRAPDWTVENGKSIRVWGQAATSLLEQGSPVDGQYVVVGHFDDAEASECTSSGVEGVPADPAFAVLTCRMQFVVTEVRPAA